MSLRENLNNNSILCRCPEVLNIIVTKDIFSKSREATKMSYNYGYVRVSSKDQNEARQLIALQNTNLPLKKIFRDKQSGKDF